MHPCRSKEFWKASKLRILARQQRTICPSSNRPFRSVLRMIFLGCRGRSRRLQQASKASRREYPALRNVSFLSTRSPQYCSSHPSSLPIFDYMCLSLSGSLALLPTSLRILLPSWCTRKSEEAHQHLSAVRLDHRMLFKRTHSWSCVLLMFALTYLLSLAQILRKTVLPNCDSLLAIDYSIDPIGERLM